MTNYIQDLVVSCQLIYTKKPIYNWNTFFKHAFFFVVDNNECAAQNSVCGSRASCVNTPGSFNCECSKGFSLDNTGFECEGELQSINISTFFLRKLWFFSVWRKIPHIFYKSVVESSILFSITCCGSSNWANGLRRTVLFYNSLRTSGQL